MIMILKTPQRQGSPAAAEEEGEGRGGGRGEEGNEKVSASEVNVGIDGAKSEIKIKTRHGHE